MIAGLAIFAYRQREENLLLKECGGDKRLLKKMKRDSAYIVEGGQRGRVQRSVKKWADEEEVDESPYYRLM
jgi:hypothetical protein